MTPDMLAALHARAFAAPNRWSARSFADLLSRPGTFLCPAQDGFALGRAVVDEAELLTLCVVPEARRRGIATRLLTDFEAAARLRGARHLHLEVAEDNGAARALYASGGWQENGRRSGYYTRADGPSVAALTLIKTLR